MSRLLKVKLTLASRHISLQYSQTAP